MHPTTLVWRAFLVMITEGLGSQNPKTIDSRVENDVMWILRVLTALGLFSSLFPRERENRLAAGDQNRELRGAAFWNQHNFYRIVDHRYWV